MNPDLIEYQKMMMAQQAQQPPMRYAPVQMLQFSPMPQESGNPIQNGAMAGMEAAKHSLGMDSHERQRAMGNAMLKFFGSMGKTGHGPGLAGALGAINSSFLPGVEGFQAEENAAMNRNYALMKQQQEMQRHGEEMALKRIAVENTIIHQNRSHELNREKLKYMKDKLSAKDGYSGIVKTEYGDIDLSQYPAIITAAQKTLYAKKYDNSSIVTKDLNSIKKTLDELSEATKGNVFSPLGSPLGSVPNFTKDYLARTAGDSELGKALRKETMLRQRLESQFARLEPVLERSAKGSAPDAQLLARFHQLKVYMNSAQPAYIVKDRLNELLEDAQALKSSARLSLLTGRQIPNLPKVDAQEEAAEGEVPEHTANLMQQMSDQQKQEIIAKTRAKFPQVNERSDDEILTWAIERPEP